jgi:hypothetical protein
MSRASLLIPALAIAALLTAPAASAATATADSRFSIDFALAANNGLDAKLEAFDDGVTFEVGSERRLVLYEIEGQATEAGLKAQFGKLGLIDVTFKPTKTLERTPPPPGCRGEPWTHTEGVFIGTIQFTGERNYVRIEETRAKGTMSSNPPWQCRDRKGLIRPETTIRPSASNLLERREPEEAALYAHNPRCRCFFSAFAIPDSKNRTQSLFYGAKIENREGMKISRLTLAIAGASAFEFDHQAGVAKVEPPHPFTGAATFVRRKGRDLWQSSLRVPLLGADPVSLRGGGFRVRLARQLPGD